MKPFLGDDFLLENDAAARLYHDTAARQPIIDYHNHLPPEEIGDNKNWDTIGRIWLEGDHYKWRAMRWAGVPEEKITGSADFRDKFDAYAAIMPDCLGNPLYHWSHLELYRYFGLDGTLISAKTAGDIWRAANEKLALHEFSARGLLRQMDVRYVGTTDDPCDTLEHHLALKGDPDLGFVLAPSFRPDKAIKIERPEFTGYLEKLGALTGQAIRSFDDLMAALVSRLDFFVAAGCKASDHGLDVLHLGEERTASELTAILKKPLDGRALSEDDIADFQTAVLVELARAYAERDLVMQFHIGAQRNNNAALFAGLGTDVGGDSIGDRPIAAALNGLLGRISTHCALPRTVLYCLDPTKNEVLVTTAGNFQDGSLPGKIQAGSGWWFNDQIDGMERQMTQLAQMGLISTFVGMLTDSRSFLSFPRHEYFRRLVANMIGTWMERGEIPPDFDMAEKLVADICYGNARRWFLD